MVQYPGEFWKDYELVDSGEGEKLERFGNYYMVRPEPKALWHRTMPADEWDRTAHTRFRPGAGFAKAGKEDSGTWERLKRTDDQWYIKYRGEQKGLDFSLRLGLTSFKHVGVFPEQAPNWEYIFKNTSEFVALDKTLTLTEEQRRAAGQTPDGRPKVLNLFAYTGGATLAAAAAGAAVTHVDASKGMVNWAKENAKSSGLEAAPIRWLVDDCMKFVEREIRRGNHYDGIIMDPPSYGRGPKGEIWKIEDSIYDFIKLCTQILSDAPLFFLVNSYTTGLAPAVLTYMLSTELKRFGGHVDSQEIGLPVTKTGLVLPCGASGRWEK